MRTTVTLDEVLLDDARRLLGTTGVSETVNAALALAVRQARLAAFDVRQFDITDDDLADARADRCGRREPHRGARPEVR
ncbi:MAG: type II toxin-antitoxin system VapB family antitoxin [Pseudonocardia sp.]